MDRHSIAGELMQRDRRTENENYFYANFFPFTAWDAFNVGYAMFGVFSQTFLYFI